VVYEVDAGGVEASHGGGDVELRAHAVGARDEHGLAVAAEPEQRREGPDAGEHLGPARRTDDLLDAGGETAAGIDIDAGGSIRLTAAAFQGH